MLLARFLAPRDLGIYGVFFSIVFLCNALGDLGLGTSLVRLLTPKLRAGEDVRGLVGSFLVARLVAVGLLAAAILGLGRGVVSSLDLFQDATPRGFLPLAAATTMAHALASHSAEVLRARLLHRSQAFARGITSALRLAAFGTLAWVGTLDLDHALPVAAGMLGLYAAALFGLAHRGQGLWPPRPTRPRRAWIVLSGWVFVTGAGTALLTHTDTLLLAGLGGAEATGRWVAAARLLGIIPLVMTAVWSAVLPVTLALDDRAKIDRYLRIARRVAGCAVAGSLVALPAVGPVIRGVLGEVYAPAASPARWLLVAFAFQAGKILYDSLVHRLRLEKPLAVLSLVLLAANVAGDLLLIPRYGAAGCAAVTAGVMIAGTIWSVHRVESSREALHATAPDAGDPPA